MNTNDLTFARWTGDKTPELALFYNLALEQMKRFLKREGGIDWESIFPDSKTTIKSIPDGALIKLKNFLWKGNNNDKNDEGSVLEESEKEVIYLLLHKLNGIRNFQSHYYHTDESLRFSGSAKSFVQKKYDEAKGQLAGKFPSELEDFEYIFIKKNRDKVFKGNGKDQIFNYHDGIAWLNKEGKNFFLSFFLTTGQMKKFLKQRKGCKRDDSPDFRFKHLLYTYYSHRDGAARFHYNQDDTFLDFDSTLSAEIEEKRQLYKINTYLHDVPPESTDPKLFPIYNANGRNLESLDELMEFAAESGAFSKLSIRRIEIETKAGIKVPEHSVYVSHKDTPNIQVQIHRETLHRILIEALKGNGDEMQRSVLRFSLERLHIHRLLEDCKLLNAFLTHRREKLARWLNEYSNFRLRNFDGLLRREFAKWMESILAGKATEIRKLKDLIVKHPPEMRYLDFYFTHNRKVRQQNEFMRFSVRYMVDRRVVPSICWQWQAFETFINKEGKSVLAEITCFQPTKPEKKTNLSCNWRLKFTHDEQILFTWNQPTEPQAANEKRQDRPKVQPLLMGHRAMKNLLTAHLVDNKDLNPFFETLSNEIRGLKEGTMDQYILLDESSIPVSLMPLKRKSLEQTLKTRVGKRLESLINQLAEDLVDPPQKRAEKNRKIMQSYLLFDWPKRPDGSSEHLRKSENNLMSIYHYTMEKHRLPNLLQEIENGRRDRIPVEVRQLLSESKSLDELFVNSLRLACDWLANRKAALSIIKGKDLKELARKISVPVYEPIEEKTKNPNTPFDIHPILILKSLYPDEYKTGGFSLSAKVWSDKKLPLIDRFYYSGQALNNLPKGKSRIQIGALNELRAQDGLLFKIGQKYEAHYNQVEDMHNSILPMVAVPDLKIKTPIFDFQPFGSPKIRARVMVKFHQLDDHMVLLAAHQVQKLIWHFLTMKQGMDANGKVKVAKDKDLIKSGVSIKRSGDQILYEIPLEGLRRAMEYVYHESLMVCQALFSFEEMVIQDNRSKLGEGDRIDFQDVVKLNGDGDKSLNEIRKHAIHSLIPDKWNYESDNVMNSKIGPDLALIRQGKWKKKEYYRSYTSENSGVKRR